MEQVARHFWAAFVAVTVVNGLVWYRRVQPRVVREPALAPGYRRLLLGSLFWLSLPWLLVGVGVFTGEIDSSVDLLSPGEERPFVLAWFALVAALAGAGTLWMFQGGGAELLARHPGTWMLPEWPASRLRRLWLAVVGWNVAIGTLLVRILPLSEDTVEGTALATWLIPLFPVVFAAFWVLILFVLSTLGGWRTLAEHYAASGPLIGQRFRLRSASFGLANYGGCLTFGAARDALEISAFFLFRPGHPPLRIPWHDIAASEVRNWPFGKAIELRCARAPGVTLRLQPRLAESLLDAAERPIAVVPLS